MLRLALSLLLLASVPALAQDWTQLPLGTSEDILYVENTSFAARWVVGTNGFAAQSDFLRENWTTVDVGTSADLLSLNQPASGQVWVGAGSGVVRRFFVDHWESRSLPNGSEDFTLFTRGSGTSWAVGTGGSVYSTADGGDTWLLKYSAGVALHGGDGLTTGVAWMVGDHGTLLRTEDGDANWALVDCGTTEDLWGFRSGAGISKYVCGTNGTILRSLDSGVTWAPTPTGTTQDIYEVCVSGLNSNWMLAVGENGTVLKSTDAGGSWCRLFPGTDANLYGGAMVTNVEYIVAGEGGVMMRTVNGGGDCFAVAVDDFVPDSAGYLNVFPNPLGDGGRVLFGSARAGAFELDLYDVSGRRVRGLLGGRVEAGEDRSHAIDTGEWTAGVYFLRLRVGDEVSSRRLTVIR